MENLWPPSLKELMDNDEVKTIHIPFREKIMSQALDDYDVNKQPSYSTSIYKSSVYDNLYPLGMD